MLPLLYRTEERYGWSVGMRAITRALLTGCALPDGPVVDLGCGGGRMLVELSDLYGDRRLHGIDLHPQALAHAIAISTPHTSFAQAHLHDLPFADEGCGLCLALDVLDQRGVDLHLALAETCRILRTGGALLLRVSAYAWLEGPHDEAFGTGHRYEMPEMLRALARAGLAPERITFANTLLSGPEGAVRLLQRWHFAPFLPSLYTTRAVNLVLRWALMLEARWLRTRDLPGGMSLYMVARKL